MEETISISGNKKIKKDPTSGESTKNSISYTTIYNSYTYTTTTILNTNERTVSIVGKIIEEPEFNKKHIKICAVIILALVILEVLIAPIVIHLLIALSLVAFTIYGVIYITKNETSTLKFHGAEHIIFNRINKNHFGVSKLHGKQSLKDYINFRYDSTLSKSCGSCSISSIIICEFLAVFLFLKTGIYLPIILVIIIANTFYSFPVFNSIGLILQKYLLTDTPDEIHLQVAMLTYLYLQENLNSNLIEDVEISVEDIDSEITRLLLKYEYE